MDLSVLNYDSNSDLIQMKFPSHPLVVGLSGLVHVLALLLYLASHHPMFGEILVKFQCLCAQILGFLDVSQHPLQLDRLHVHLWWKSTQSSWDDYNKEMKIVSFDIGRQAWDEPGGWRQNEIQLGVLVIAIKVLMKTDITRPLYSSFMISWVSNLFVIY